jgi:hypothetical protein
LPIPRCRWTASDGYAPADATFSSIAMASRSTPQGPAA